MGAEVIELLRCLVTGNPCGTDTRMIGSTCRCQVCVAHEQLSAQSAEIARLQEKVRQADVVASIALSERNFSVAKDAEIARLRKALKPFADAVESLDDNHTDGGHLWESPAAMNITAGDLRRARAALETKG